MTSKTANFWVRVILLPPTIYARRDIISTGVTKLWE